LLARRQDASKHHQNYEERPNRSMPAELPEFPALGKQFTRRATAAAGWKNWRNRGVRRRAEQLYAQLDKLAQIRREARQELLRESSVGPTIRLKLAFEGPEQRRWQVGKTDSPTRVQVPLPTPSRFVICDHLANWLSDRSRLIC
jgi:hypothetical protein